MTSYKIDFSKGLVPAILQNNQTKQVLVLGRTNQEVLGKTIEDGVVCFYSWSKQRLWTEGETSGHTQRVKDIHIDYDNNTTLVDVIPNGPTCHIDSQSCFNTEVPFSIQTLAQMVQDSVRSNSEEPHTKYSSTEDIEKITRKHGEEALEVVIGAIKGDKKAFMSEVANELYHLFVLMHALDVGFSETKVELARKHHKRNNSKGERRNIGQW